jgi:phage/plasmid-like protein (TIGR03299 family)
MAHNLNFNEQTQTYSFFSVKEKAWHNLGKVVTEAQNSEQAIKLGGLDFQVEKARLFAEIATENNIVPDTFATYRKDNNQILGVVGSSYKVVQNADAFTFFDSIVGKGAAIYETAGCLNKGEVIFITAKLPSTIRVGSDDLIEQYLFLTSTHDGTGSIQAAFTPVRIVCNNTLNAALRNCSNKISIRHTANVKEKLYQAHRIMGISHVMEKELDLIFNRMAKVTITDKQLKNIVAQALAPTPEALEKFEAEEEISKQYSEAIDACLEYSYTAPSQLLDTTKGTVYGAYNAITGFYQNIKNFKSEDSKLRNILSGNVQKNTQIAFNLALSHIQ